MKQITHDLVEIRDLGSGSTYEGLKPDLHIIARADAYCSGSTYEGLKLRPLEAHRVPLDVFRQYL